MKLMVLTCAVFPSESDARAKLWIFLRSCEKFGVEPHLYGIGETFPGYRAMKLEMQLAYLKANAGDYTHVLYTDSWDAFFVAPLTEIVAKYEAMGSPEILSSAYFDLGNKSDKVGFEECFNHDVYYRYPNVGGYMAEIPAIIAAFERMLTLPNQTGDDCHNWYDAWREGWFRPKLDSNCEIFQVTAEHCRFDEPSRRLINIKTGASPCILHLSGGFTDSISGKDDRMIPWARTLGVIA